MAIVSPITLEEIIKTTIRARTGQFCQSISEANSLMTKLQENPRPRSSPARRFIIASRYWLARKMLYAANYLGAYNEGD